MELGKYRQIFVTGIGTGVGKTLVSAILSEYLSADYWKPVQSGDLNDSDSMQIRKLCSSQVLIHPEAYKLAWPISPHAAAAREGLEIDIKKISLPTTFNNLVIEGAGGLLVPVNADKTMADLIEHLNVPVVVVSKNYLGSINHTLLTFEALRSRNLDVAGIIFNGEENRESEEIICRKASVPCLLNIREEKYIDRETVLKYAGVLKKTYG